MVYSFSNNDSIHLKIYIRVHIMSLGRQVKYYPDRIRNVGLRLCQKFKWRNPIVLMRALLPLTEALSKPQLLRLIHPSVDLIH